MPGWKAYLSTAQAMVAMDSLLDLDERKDRLSNIRGKYIMSGLTPENVESDHLYIIRAGNRDELMAALAEEGIATGIHYMPMDEVCSSRLAVRMKNQHGSRDCEQSRTIGQQLVSIPFHAGLTDKDVEHVIECTNKYRRLPDNSDT
jgi:perosamine synthetase